MPQITQKLTAFVWNGSPDAPLGGLGWTAGVELLRTLNPQGTGYLSYNPAVSLNAFATLTSGRTYILQAKAAAYAGAGFQVDNGTASNGGGEPITWPSFTEPSSGPYTQLEGLVNVSRTYVPTFSFTIGGGSLQVQLNGDGNWSVPAPITPGTTAEFRLQHTAPFAGTLTLTPA